MAISTPTLVALWVGLGLLMWFLSLFVPSPPSGFLLTPEKLRDSLSKTSDQFIRSIVSHRGFHYANVDMKRPLENTLAAYERAWSCGVIYAECDIYLSKDGEIVLSHDSTLQRLALHAENVKKSITKSDFDKELAMTPLKDGSRVPKLVEVLQAAQRFGKSPKLMVEIKDTNLECTRKLLSLAATGLGEHIGIVMSFDLNSVAEYAKGNPRKGAILSLLITVRQDDKDGSLVFSLDRIGEYANVIAQSKLDGLYVQYDPLFLTDARFLKLTQRYVVGVWDMDRDVSTTATLLMQRGAKFVNTDFADDFFHA